MYVFLTFLFPLITNVTRMLFCWVSIKNCSFILCGTQFTLLLGDILLPKTFYNSALLSRFFVCFALFRLRIFSSISYIFRVSVRHMCLLLFTCTIMSNSLPPQAHQSPLFTGNSRQEYWSGLPCSPTRDLPDPEMEFTSATALALQVDSLLLSENRSCIHETHFIYEDS